MKRIKTFIAAFILVAMGAMVLVPVSSVGAAFDKPLDGACANNGDAAVCEDQNKNASSNDLVRNIVNILLFVVGALAVVMIIVGGLFYVTSQGDSSNITKAKNTILYAVIGLIVSVLAYAIVNWVVDLF